MEPSNNLASLLAQFIAEHNHFIGTDRISSAESSIQQAVQCFVEYLNSSIPRSSRARTSLATMLECQEVADALKHWRGGINQNIMHLAYSCRDSILMRTLIQKIGTDPIFESDKLGKFPVQNAEDLLPLKDMEEFQTIAKNILLIKRQPILQPKILLPHLRFTEADKLQCAKVLNELSTHDLNNDEILCNTWYQLAQLFPSSEEDIDMATKLIVHLLQQPRRYTREGLLHNMLKSYPNIDSDHVLNSVKKWPRYNSEFVAAFIRDTNAPYWLMQGILGTSLKDCNYSWIQKQLATKNRQGLDESLPIEHVNMSFHLFEELPEDIIYYMMSHMHFRHIIALSQTSKRMMKLVNESQHVWTMFGHRYFTKLSVTSGKDFGQKYRSKFKTGKLLHQFRPMPSNYINSIELNGDSALLVQSSGLISLLRTRCLDRPKNRKKLTTIQLRKGWTRSARLFNDWIFTVTLPVSFETKHDEHITIINTKNTKLQHHIKSPFVITNDTNPYFTIDGKTLLAKGFSMDVASGTITEVPWTVDLSKWIIRDDIVYGTEIVRHFPETTSSTAWLKLFDQRTPGKLAAALQLQNLRCFNVSDHNIYAVTSHIMQWDKRYLSRPVRKSTDLYYYSKNNPIGNPAIDLTSMTVIGADQIWDLTDFTWQLPNPYRVPPRITTNGILVAYSNGHVVNLHQVPCTYSNSNESVVVTPAELNCQLSSNHLNK